MPLFSEMFIRTKSQKINYKNRVLHRAFSIEAPKNIRIILTFLEKNSEYCQGVSFNMFTMKGSLTCNNITINKGSFSIWEDTGLNRVIVDAHIEIGELCIFNLSKRPDYRGVIGNVSLDMGSCFYYDQIAPNKYRCYCNDWEPDDDFDDLIFDIEFIDLEDASRVVEIE